MFEDFTELGSVWLLVQPSMPANHLTISNMSSWGLCNHWNLEMFVWFWNLDCIVLIPEYYEKEILCCIMEQEAILNNNWSTLFLVLGWIIPEKLGEENTVCHSQPSLDAFWYSLSDLASLNNVIKIGKIKSM
jgi:hypothetical protein